MSTKKLLAAICVAALSLGLAGNVAADEAPLADGTAWTAASEAEKEAYLVGVGNMLKVEYVVQSKSDNPPNKDQSAIGRWWDGLESVTANQAIMAVDAWYAANPGKLDTPVIMVLWHTYVEKM